MEQAVIGVEERWRLGDARAAGLAGRLVVTTVGIGVVGAGAMVGLGAVFVGSEITPAAAVLALVLPANLLVMIIRRFAAAAGRSRSAPSGRRMVATATVSSLLLVTAQGWTMLGESFGLWSIPAVIFAGPMYGSQFGVIAGLVVSAVVVPVVLLVRLAGARIGLGAMRIALTGVAMVLTAGLMSLLSVADETGALPSAGMVTALVGIGGILVSRWTLTGSRSIY